jgi:hypothetical protein
MDWTFYTEPGQIRNEAGDTVATITRDDYDVLRGKLMAASPLLFQACRAALQHFQTSANLPMDVVNLLELAIDKADQGENSLN